MMVALYDHMVVGTLSVVKSWDNIEGSFVFLTIFVDPRYHKFYKKRGVTLISKKI